MKVWINKQIYRIKSGSKKPKEEFAQTYDQSIKKGKLFEYFHESEDFDKPITEIETKSVFSKLC